MANRFVRATFSTGLVVGRGSVNKIYTHAYLTSGKRPDGRVWELKGFSTSAEQCRRNMEAESAWLRKSDGYTVVVAEVVAVEVVPQPCSPAPVSEAVHPRSNP